METKEEILERLMDAEKPKCPECGVEMCLWETPPINFSDGLGWGSPYLYVCFNDECPPYVGGWKSMEENFGQVASYRCFNYPETNQFECMPVFSPVGAQGQILDENAVYEQEVLKENIKRGFSILSDCYVQKDGPTVLKMLLDPTEPVRVRLKAANMIGDLGEQEAIDPLRSHKFPNEKIQMTVDESIKKIHERFFTRECPFCAEVIKNRAKICKHCGKDVAGE